MNTNTITQRLRDIAFRLRKPRDGRPWGADDGAAYLLDAIAAQLDVPAADAVPVKWQDGLDNEQLRAAFKRKLPAVDPTDRDLSVFALGVEVGESIDASAWNRLHHVLKRHGLHPGRTDDDIIDITDKALATVAALQARIDELESRWNLCSACNAELGGAK